MEINQALQEFVGAFEVVFRYDWEYSKVMLGDEDDRGNFIEPNVEDESEDWGRVVYFWKNIGTSSQ